MELILAISSHACTAYSLFMELIPAISSQGECVLEEPKAGETAQALPRVPMPQPVW